MCFRTRNCCTGDRRLRRIQGAGAEPRVAEAAAPQGTPSDAGHPRPVQGGAPQCATNSPADCWLARGRFPSGHKSGEYPTHRSFQINVATIIKAGSVSPGFIMYSPKQKSGTVLFIFSVSVFLSFGSIQSKFSAASILSFNLSSASAAL